MTCDQCRRDGKRSRVYPGVGTTTLMASHPYYDEDGRYVNDDPNITTTPYSCSNGHRWSTKTQGNETTVTVLPPVKPDQPLNVDTTGWNTTASGQGVVKR